MVQEDQTTSSSGNNSNIGRTAKKQRPKKVPQRGLGVAQLEKIRLQEQHKKDSDYLVAAADVSVPSSNVPLTSVDGHKFWGSCDFNIGKECSFGLDPGLVFRANLSLPYETEPLWHLPSLMQRGGPLSCSMVNLSSRTSSSKSVMNFQMEPPSNQSYYKNFKPLCPEEDKVIGMKRPYPFSLDNAPGPSFLTNCYPPIVHSINGQVGATSSNKAPTFGFEPDTSNLREGPSCSTTNGVFGRDFLKLAPPTTTSMCSTSKSKHPLSNSIPYESPGLDQGSCEDSIMKQGGGLNLQRPYYSFFPAPAMAQIERASAVTMANCKSAEVAGHVDLNLKL
ncbi:hypothetical protein V6N13_085294 [Hibiscus sabdariffa]|uniref:Uncharacterized protein n=1 Tax=Hibiscus sabdariffa TaxID=183260 RepID=A0ABR2D145_9ROSI